MTYSEMRQWIDNDEGLYNWWRSTRLPISKFIKEYGPEIRAAIRRVYPAQRGGRRKIRSTMPLFNPAKKRKKKSTRRRGAAKLPPISVFGKGVEVYYLPIRLSDGSYVYNIKLLDRGYKRTVQEMEIECRSERDAIALYNKLLDLGDNTIGMS